MKELSLKSPFNGIVMPIEQVPDQVFAQKMVGDGLGFDPISNKLMAPCNGKVVQLHPSHHAITIESESGKQILLHIGLDTVNLKGEGFKPLVKLGDQVTTGQDLIEFDSDFIAVKGMSLVSVMVFVDSDEASNSKTASFGTKVNSSNEVASLNMSPQSERKNKKQSALEKAYESVPFFVRLPSGMHARPAAQLAELSKNYSSSIELIKDGKTASLSSIISVLGLEIEKNDEVIVLAVGPDCQEAVKAVLAYLVKLEEEELITYEKEKSPAPDKKIVEIESNERTLVGVSASDGVVIGKISILKKEELSFEKMADDAEEERLSLENALLASSEQLIRIENSLEDKSKAAIFSAHREMLSDSELLDESVDLINKGHSAACAWDETIKHRAERLENMNNELIAGRANDLRDIGHRVLRNILGLEEKTNSHEKNIILVAEDLTPSDTIQLDRSKVLGFCTTSGGATSHVAILARSMDIPAIAGIEGRVMDLTNGTEVVLDGDHGALYLNPSAEEKIQVKARQEKLELKKKEALAHSSELAKTLDGKRVEVVANISGVLDAEKSVEVGGEGVGLLRTEFLFLDRDHAPSEEEQLEIYQGIVNALGDRPLVIRTLDIGGDKELNYLPMPKEENPFLGVRGIRLCLKKESLFREQLRAILKVETKRPLNLMFPMIGQLWELREAKKILAEELSKLPSAVPPKVGMMMEVPSAAIMAEQFAREVDFFSVGTNDLTQYVMAMDRGHNELAKQVDGLHPAVLNMIATTVKAAHKHGKWVGVCGGIASDPKAIPVLLGLGVDELSLSIPNIPMIKSTIRELNKQECQEMSEQFLNAESGKQVRELVLKKWPQLF